MGIQNINVVPSNFEENLDKANYTPKEYVRNTALGKARAVYDRLKANNEHENTVIVSADTVIELEGKIYEKPRNAEEQLINLKKFRDSVSPQHVLSGVIVIVDGVEFTHVEDTSIVFDPEASDELLEAYVGTGEGLDVAAGYRVQSLGALLMKRIEGDYFNVVGLPFRGTFVLLQKALSV
ncbi:CYFA0S25e00122g1_1 [Cyberlindnera fabianii]|nr:CYFA0S25e00122g1_1 [Cyberlindnera fabianii]